MIYAVIDTNVLVSAMLKWESVPGQILQHAFLGKIIPLFNEIILQEYKEVHSRPKFKFDTQKIQIFLEEIEKRGINLEAESLDLNLPAPKDIVFYEVVMEKRKTDDTFLVTENIKHFPSVPFILTPREMLDLIETII